MTTNCLVSFLYFNKPSNLTSYSYKISNVSIKKFHWEKISLYFYCKKKGKSNFHILRKGTKYCIFPVEQNNGRTQHNRSFNKKQNPNKSKISTKKPEQKEKKKAPYDNMYF